MQPRVCASLANLHKHVAAFHVPGNKHKTSSDYICINCSQSFKYNSSLRRHARSCVTMVRADSDMDIAEEEPTAGVGTGYTVEKELDRAATGPNSDSDPHTNIRVSLAPAQSSVVYMRDPGTEDSQGHTDS